MKVIPFGGILYWTAVAFFGQALLDAPSLAGQPGGRPAAKPPASQVEFEIVRLKYVTAADTAKLLQDTFDPEKQDSSLRLVPDERTNSLIIRAPVAKFAEITQVLKKIDVAGALAPPEQAPTKLTIFELHSLVPDAAVQQALQTVIANNGFFSVDAARKMVIVQANPVTTEAVRDLLMRLENVGKSRAEEPAQVRIVWLFNSVAPPEQDPPLPASLKEVLPGLAKLGINRPKIAAEIVVNAQTGKRFQTTGTTRLSEAEYVGAGPGTAFTLSAQGNLTGSTPSALQITLDVTRGSPKRTVCSLQTEITAPSGHLVVLGVTPVEGLNSAFVVQLIRKDAKEKRE